MPSPIRSSVDFTKPGKQFGHLYVPYSHNLGGWANLMLPIAVVARGHGPTVLVLAGNHGDEYPGQVAIMRLLRELKPEQVSGRVILVPTLTMPAAKAATRLSPLDGKNFNRSFPGNPAGTMCEVIAHYLTTVLFPLADVVIDIHTGGRSTDFYPCAHMHLVPAGPQRDKMLAGTEAWNTDFCFLYADIAGTGLLARRGREPGQDRLHDRDGRQRERDGAGAPPDAIGPAQCADPRRRVGREGADASRSRFAGRRAGCSR